MGFMRKKKLRTNNFQNLQRNLLDSLVWTEILQKGKDALLGIGQNSHTCEWKSGKPNKRHI